MVAPAFLRTEVGSVLRKQARLGEITDGAAQALLDHFLDLEIELVEGRPPWLRAWSWAERTRQPTLHDACYLAALEIVCRAGDRGEFWTADERLAADLAEHRPTWLRLLSEWPAPPSPGPQ